MKKVLAQKIATAILLVAFVVLQAPGIQAQDLPTKSPFLLFSTSDAVDLPATRTEVHAKLNKIRSRRQTATARAVSIANVASAVQAATIRLELDGRTITVDRDRLEHLDEGKDRKQLWQGRSNRGDELDLLLWRGRLSGRLRTHDQAYKIRFLEESLFALIEIAQLDPTPLGCDTPEAGTSEAVLQQGAYTLVSPLESVGISKSSSAQQDTRVLAVYTDDALDEYNSLQDLETDITWGLLDAKTAFSRTEAVTRPKHVGTEWISFQEPASWSSSSVIWQDSLPPFDAEIYDLREEYEADVVMLILKDGSTSPCCRGSSRAILPTDIDDAIFYVDTPYVDHTEFYTPAHEIGHIFGAFHGDGYFIKDTSGDDVFEVCFTNHQTTYRTTRTLMFDGTGGTYERRALFYSSNGKTITHWCPDEEPPIPSYHTFQRGISQDNAENLRIEPNEDDVSNFWEDLGSSMTARAGTGAPTALDDAGLSFTVENYPNPFNPQTTIRISLQEDAHIRLTVYDVLGREIMVLVDGIRLAGTHEARFDGSRLPSGLYVYRLTVTGEGGAQEATGRLTLLR